MTSLRRPRRGCPGGVGSALSHRRRSLVGLAALASLTVGGLTAGSASAAAAPVRAAPGGGPGVVSPFGVGCGPAALAGACRLPRAAAGSSAGAAGTASTPAPGSWSLATSQDRAGQAYNLLYGGVSCVSATDCWAAGASGDGVSVGETLLERWDGSTWTIVPSPNSPATFSYGVGGPQARSSYLSGVSCVSASDCWAVGGYYTTGASAGSYVTQTLILQWDGASWQMVAAPDPVTGPGVSDTLSGVGCTGPAECWAIGDSEDGDGSAEKLVLEKWDGSSWQVASSPAVVAQYAFLNAITCPDSHGCWAVGGSTNSSTDQTLIEHWDGSAWSIVTSADTSPTQQSILYGVACAAASDCWSVGFYSSPSVYQTYQTLIEHWDGTAWAITPSPNTAITQYNYLQGVTCATATECWAVGAYSNGQFNQTVIERWDGAAWSLVATPNADTTHDNILYGVACSTAACWADGYYFNGSAYRSLIEEHVEPATPTPTLPESPWPPLALLAAAGAAALLLQRRRIPTAQGGTR